MKKGLLYFVFSFLIALGGITNLSATKLEIVYDNSHLSFGMAVSMAGYTSEDSVYVVCRDGKIIGSDLNVLFNDLTINAGMKFLDVRQVTFASNVINAGANATSALEEVVIPASVETIAAGSFAGAPALKKVTAPGVKTVDNYAFRGCTALKSISFPEATTFGIGAFQESGLENIFETDVPNLEIVNMFAFAGCENLRNIRLEKVTTIDKTAFPWDPAIAPAPTTYKFRTLYLGSFDNLYANFFDGHPTLVEVTLEKATSIGNEAFQNMPLLGHVVMPLVTNVGDKAFYNCPILNDVVLPKAVTVGQYAFYGYNANLKNISLPEATHIGDFAFTSCYALEHINFPKLLAIEDSMLPAFPDSIITINMDAVTTINDKRFKDYVKLNSISLNSAVTIGDSAFYNTVLTSLSLPSATDLGRAAAITTNGSIATIDMPELVTIGDSALMDNDLLTHITLDKLMDMGVNPFPVTLEYLSTAVLQDVPDFAFKEYTVLEEVNMPEVINIGDSAFVNTILREANMPKLEVMGRLAFLDVSTLTSINFPLLETIRDSALWGTTLTDVRLQSLDSMGVNPFPVTMQTVQLDVITLIPDSAFMENGVLNTVILPEVISIGDSAFYNLGALQTIDLPKVDTIGNYSFYNCDLQSITPPNFDQLRVLGDSALVGNLALTRIELPMVDSIGNNSFPFGLTWLSLPAIEFIADSAFTDYAVLQTVKMEQVKEIDSHAFEGCAVLDSIYFPSLITLGDSVFIDTDLTEVTMESLKEFGINAFDKDMTYLDLPVIEVVKDYGLMDYPLLGTALMPALDSIGVKGFYNCDALTSVEFPALAALEDSAFADCDLLEKITFNSLQEIGHCAFFNAISLDTLNLPAVNKINGQAFASSGITAIDFPLVADPNLADSVFMNCPNLENISFTNPAFTTVPQYSFNGCTALDSIRSTDLPYVANIDNNAFEGNTALKYVKMDNLTTIGNDAFKDCNTLGIVDIRSIATIGANAFDNCSNLAILEVGNTYPTVNSPGAFAGVGSSDPVLVFVDADNAAAWGTTPHADFPNAIYLFNEDYPRDTTIYVGEDLDIAYNFQPAIVSNISWDTPKGLAPSSAPTGIPTYSIYDALPADDGDYQLTFTYNNANVTLDHKVNVTVICHPTEITSQPLAYSGVLCDGDVYQLSTAADGSKLSYQWYKNDTPIADAINSTYVASESGLYKVLVTNACGTDNIFSNEIAVTINPITAITSNLEDASVCEDNPYTMSVTAVGSNLSYQWYREGTPIQDATNSYYHIDSIKPGDYDNYSVKVTGICGSSVMSDTARVWVADSLRNIILDVPSSVIAGQKYQLHVGNDYGYSDVTEYIWEFSNDQVNFQDEEGRFLHTTYATFGPEPLSGTITVKMKHGCAPAADNGYYIASQYVIVNPSGIDGNEADIITIYPNPVVDVLTIKGTAAKAQSIRLYNTQGKQLGVYDAQDDITTINFVQFGQGTYILNIDGQSVKIVK